MTRLRWARGVATALLVLPLAACTLRGDVHVSERGIVTVDAVFQGDWETAYSHDLCGPWSWDGTSVTVTELDAPPGQSACHLTGTLTPERLFLAGVVVVSPDTAFLRGGQSINQVDPVPGGTLDLTIHFPGEVLAASGGRVVGNTVHFSDPDLALTHGVSVTGSLRRELPSWLLPLVAALGWGAILGTAGLWLFGWLDEDEDEPDASRSPTSPPEPADQPRSPRAPDPRPLEDPSVWAP